MNIFVPYSIFLLWFMCVASSQIPSPWTEHRWNDRTYFYNSVTGESRWTLPTSPVAPLSMDKSFLIPPVRRRGKLHRYESKPRLKVKQRRDVQQHVPDRSPEAPIPVSDSSCDVHTEEQMNQQNFADEADCREEDDDSVASNTLDLDPRLLDETNHLRAPSKIKQCHEDDMDDKYNASIGSQNDTVEIAQQSLMDSETEELQPMKIADNNIDHIAEPELPNLRMKLDKAVRDYSVMKEKVMRYKRLWRKAKRHLRKDSNADKNDVVNIDIGARKIASKVGKDAWIILQRLASSIYESRHLSRRNELEKDDKYFEKQLPKDATDWTSQIIHEALNHTISQLVVNLSSEFLFHQKYVQERERLEAMTTLSTFLMSQLSHTKRNATAQAFLLHAKHNELVNAIEQRLVEEFTLKITQQEVEKLQDDLSQHILAEENLNDSLENAEETLLTALTQLKETNENHEKEQRDLLLSLSSKQEIVDALTENLRSLSSQELFWIVTTRNLHKQCEDLQLRCDNLLEECIQKTNQVSHLAAQLQNTTVQLSEAMHLYASAKVDEFSISEKTAASRKWFFGLF